MKCALVFVSPEPRRADSVPIGAVARRLARDGVLLHTLHPVLDGLGSGRGEPCCLGMLATISESVNRMIADAGTVGAGLVCSPELASEATLLEAVDKVCDPSGPDLVLSVQSAEKGAAEMRRTGGVAAPREWAGVLERPWAVLWRNGPRQKVGILDENLGFAAAWDFVARCRRSAHLTIEECGTAWAGEAAGRVIWTPPFLAEAYAALLGILPSESVDQAALVETVWRAAEWQCLADDIAPSEDPVLAEVFSHQLVRNALLIADRFQVALPTDALTKLEHLLLHANRA